MTQGEPSKAHGQAQSAMGSVKSAVGGVFSNELQAKGEVQKQQGEAEI